MVRLKFPLYKDEHRFLTIGYDFHSQHVISNELNQAKSFSQSDTQGMESQNFISFKIGYTKTSLQFFFRMGEADWHDLATVDTAIMTDYDFRGPVIGIFAIGEDIAVEFGDFQVDIV
ncbi:Concanavalin A-like lectin/glucanase subgroup [Penicillium hordei]|uniref:Concanavalin A-like lectin/glucanase subgroup n=1 Tax=Penicillium hordei TaxID=40994 RepID=A0AAD6E5G0_9EURO|nr:Concanavalin A-like lectin/glucanase subgroup [Penicillium hordei]KAJ5602301.1 Concanavalin A-like lectin/glucanase subgroup [Penicillium hordei]